MRPIEQIITEILELRGTHHQLCKVAEEASEMAVAALHLREGRDYQAAKLALAKEAADVEIALLYVRRIIGSELVDEAMRANIELLNHRLDTNTLL